MMCFVLSVMSGTRECKDLNIDVKCNSRQGRSAHATVEGEEKVIARSDRVTREASDTYNVQISFPAIKYVHYNLSFYFLKKTFEGMVWLQNS